MASGSGRTQTVHYDTESDSDVENQVPRKRRKTLDYFAAETFSNFLAAKQYVTDLKHYIYRNKFQTESTEIHQYACRQSFNCSSRCRIVLQLKSEETVVEKTNLDHDHIEKPSRGIPQETASEIIKLLEYGTNKPKTIINALQRMGIVPPTKTQLNNFLKTKRNKENPAIVSLGEFEAKCIQLSSVPDDMDDPFVVRYTVDYSNKKFGLLISTKRLINYGSYSKALHCDATYKLNWEGFPVLIAGVSDKNKKFHPIGISLTSGETTEDFKFLFSSLKQFIGNQYTPEVLIADAAEAITNAFTETFGNNFIRVFCWFHLCKNIDNKKLLVKDKAQWAQIKADIKELQLSRCNDDFNAAKALWIKKYAADDTIKEFVNFFIAEHLDERSGWYEGCAPGFPSTNNGLESTNTWIKQQGTFRERLPLSQLINLFLDQSRMWSLGRSPMTPDQLYFATEVTISLQVQTSAFNWVQGKPDIKFRNFDLVTHYFVSSANQPKLKEQDITKYLGMTERRSWKSFDTYKASINRLWLVKWDLLDWKMSTCSCPAFMKDYVCKHFIGIAIIRNDHSVCPEAKTVPFGTRRKRGRPAKATKALITM